jgi:FkbM family methyltransferase
MIYWPLEFHKLLPKGWLKPAALGWLVPKSLRAYAMVAKHRFTVENRQGLLLLLDQKSYIDTWLLVRGSWERPQIEYLAALISKYCAGREAIFLDVGAHGGLYSLVLHKNAKFERIIAFEPDPRNLAQLHANLLMNNATHAVEVFPIALSGFDGHLMLLQDENRAVTQVTEASGERSTIPCSRLDSLVDVKGKVIVCKIDVEGHEADVLRGMTTLIENNKVVLQVEIHDTKRDQMLSQLAELKFELLKEIAPHDYFLIKE